MSAAPEPVSLQSLARAGFVELGAARDAIEEASREYGADAATVARAFDGCADPDQALTAVLSLLRRDPGRMSDVLADPVVTRRLLAVLGVSSGLAAFLERHPDRLSLFEEPVDRMLRPDGYGTVLSDAVAPFVSAAAPTGDPERAWNALRIAYRERLAAIACFDLAQDDPREGVDRVASALSDLAGAALDGALAVARHEISGTGPGRFPASEVASTRLAIVGMGKAGARELNYVSDVDVIFVGEAEAESDLSVSRAIDIATRLAVVTMRGLDAPASEPGLWPVDANLRPEGKAGALVRSLDSHVAYYERWAKGWEFQALLKARPLAGDLELGRRYVEAIAPLVWARSAEPDFVQDVQRMRERVTDNIPPDEVDVQVKLGPGGLRDIEFTVQLLELVHGRRDDDVRERATLPALAALARGGYIGRSEAADFATDYRTLRLLEHRIQLRRLRRTHLMPREEPELRVLARATGLAATGPDLVERWTAVKRRVRGLHERLFYRPLLRSVATIEGVDTGSPDSELGDRAAEERLGAIGFADARGALGHIRALTSGVSRRAAIQRTLLPVILEWLAAGADPDHGLLAFRRLSEELGGTHWYLRLLRDSSVAAERLTRVLSGSRFAADLLRRIPEATAWLGSDDELRPRSSVVLGDETRAILERHTTPEGAASALRTVRRRETLRLALSAILGFCTVRELADGLTAVADALISGVLAALQAAGETDGIAFAVIGMGRLGGRELGFGSDADVLWVYRAAGADAETAARTARRTVERITALTDDPRLPLDLDADLRPEGRNGPIVRTVEAYRAYYERWSLTWEAQALLRSRGIAGDEALRAEFTVIADRVRYPSRLDDTAAREIRRIKARVEKERLPSGTDPSRHLKLGRGSLSDVEWLVQMLQLQNAARVSSLKTTSTLGALEVAEEAGLIDADDAERLRAAWLLASRVRSAVVLWSARTTDVLPADRRALEGVARLLEYPPGSASRLETDYLAVTRRSRAVFDRLFFGPS